MLIVIITNIIIVNIISMEAAEDMTEPHVFLYKNGTITYTSHLITKTPCPMNLVDFPFDSSSCNIGIGSWSSSNSEVCTMR